MGTTTNLTRREREVADLVAEGLTNREIAARLFISERTAESHVEQIRSKLGFHSRAQIAAWVTAGARVTEAVPTSSPPAGLAAATASSAPHRSARLARSAVAAAATVVLAALVLGVAYLSASMSAVPNAGPIISTLAGNGERVFSGDGGQAKATALIRPLAIALQPTGEIYVAEGNRIRLIRRDGTVATFAGSGSAGDSGDGGQASQARLDGPQGLAVDSTGNVYIADTLNHRVRRVGKDGVITTVAGTGRSGYSGDNGPGFRAELNLPTGLAIGFDDALYIADTGNYVVRRLGRDGVIKTAVGTGESGYRGDPGLALFAVLNAPAGLAFDSEGNLYIADTLNERVRRVDVNGSIGTVAGTGVAGYGGDGGPATDAQINLASNPLEGVGQGLAVDSRGNIYIADALNHRVRRIDLHGVITTYGGGSNSATLGDGGPALGARLGAPLGLAVDEQGALYVADAGDNRVRRIG